MTPDTPQGQPEPIPFPFNMRNYCPYEPIEKRIAGIRALVVNCLLTDRSHLSQLALDEWGADADAKLARERQISRLALGNIESNIRRLVRAPDIREAHLSEVSEKVEEFKPHAIIISGTLTDFDYYNPEMLRRFGDFVTKTSAPVLAICGSHQLIGICFGAHCVTLRNREPRDERADAREFEYQYRFVRITDASDPIFEGIDDKGNRVWQDYTTEGRILRVWQNHGLQLDHVPEGFKLLAAAYKCHNQMMVKRTEGQLIYTVQFHLEKSFQDLTVSH